MARRCSEQEERIGNRRKEREDDVAGIARVKIEKKPGGQSTTKKWFAA
jgi:hypothetical protein